MGWAPISPWRLIGGSGQNVSIGASSTQSSAFGSQTYAIRVVATGACHIEIGANPTAVATSALVAASQKGEVFAVRPGEIAAVIQDGSSTGNCNIVELTH